MTISEGFQETVGDFEAINKIYDECDRVKIKHKGKGICQNHTNPKTEHNTGSDFYTAEVTTIIGPTTLYKSCDSSAGRDWTYSLNLPEKTPELRSVDVIARMGPYKTDAEWLVLVDAFVKKQLTPKWQDKLDKSMGFGYFDNHLLPALKELVYRAREQKIQKEKNETEALRLKAALEKVEGTGYCPSHVQGFIRENEGKRLEVVFHNPRASKALCTKCGTPTASLVVIKQLK